MGLQCSEESGGGDKSKDEARVSRRRVRRRKRINEDLVDTEVRKPDVQCSVSEQTVQHHDAGQFSCLETWVSSVLLLSSMALLSAPPPPPPLPKMFGWSTENSLHCKRRGTMLVLSMISSAK